MKFWITVVFVLLILYCVGVNGKEIAKVSNEAGGFTILTDDECAVSEKHLMGIATSKEDLPMSFCWVTDKSEKNVLIFFPLNKQISIPIDVFEKPDAKEGIVTKPIGGA
jgi:hypothetical protein